MPHTRRKRRRRTIAAVAVVSLALLVVAGRAVWLSFEGFPFPATSPGRYRAVSGHFRPNRVDGPGGRPLLSGFPADVPEHASDVRFYYETPPGDVDLELRCVLPPADVATIAARAAADARLSFDGYGGSAASPPLDVPPVFHLNDGPPDGQLSPAYSVYVTGIEHARSDDGRSGWTYESGVAVDRSRNVVIWWMSGSASGASPAPPATGP